MRHWSLRARLIMSFAMVVGTGALSFYIAARFLVPRLFDQRMGSGGMGRGPGSSAGQHDVLVSSVNTAMLVALAATLVCSAVIAVVMSRRTLRSIDELRTGTAQLAAGRYDTRVARPGESELGELADDINHLASALADTERRRAALIGDVAHEMRTPLTTIRGTLEGYDDGLFSELELTDAVHTEVDRLQRLAGDLAAVSRAEEGQLQLDRRAGDLADVVRTTVERLRPRFEEAHVAIRFDGAPHVPAQFDHDRMVQVITNLLTNALAYTPASGTVTVRAASAAATVVVSVTDTGRGLTPDQLPHVFERFYRADRGDHSGGTGIGLTISRAIVRAHGGELTAASAGSGAGSTFEFTIPTG